MQTGHNRLKYDPSHASSDSISEFEHEFAKRIGSKYAVAVSSGTAGLIVGMMAVLRQPGDKVVTTPLTHIST